MIVKGEIGKGIIIGKYYWGFNSLFSELQLGNTVSYTSEVIV